MIAIRENAGRAKALLICFYFLLAISLLHFPIFFYRINLFTSLDQLLNVNLDLVDLTDNIFMVLEIADLALQVVCAILFTMWFRRAYFNMSLRIAMSQDDAWAVGSWFVPFLNFVRPYQMMRELYVEMIAFNHSRKPDYVTPFSGALLGWWWAGWLISKVVSNFVNRFTDEPESLEGFKSLNNVQMFETTLTIASLILAIFLVRKMSALESEYQVLSTLGPKGEAPQNLENADPFK